MSTRILSGQARAGDRRRRLRRLAYRRPAARGRRAPRSRVVDNMVRGRPENLSAGAGQRPRASWSRATSATRALMRGLVAGTATPSSTRPPCASPIAPPSRTRRCRSWCRRHLSTCCGCASRRKVRKVVMASSASIYGMAEVFPTTEAHHPYGNRTLYGAAKPSARGCCGRFNDMYGLDYVALRYFNVYGPRMDMHGRYTEVMVRWMERIAAGEPPIIFGDGLQTMDMVARRATWRGPTSWPPRPRRATPSSMSAARPRPRSSIWRGLLAAAMGRPDLIAGPRGRARGQSGAAPARLRPAPRASAGLRGRRSRSRQGLAELVDWWRDEVRAEAAGMEAASMIPIAKPFLGPEEAEAASAAVLSGWLVARARRSPPSRRSSPRWSARPTPARCRTAPPRCTWRCSRSASVRATR